MLASTAAVHFEIFAKSVSLRVLFDPRTRLICSVMPAPGTPQDLQRPNGHHQRRERLSACGSETSKTPLSRRQPDTKVIFITLRMVSNHAILFRLIWQPRGTNNNNALNQMLRAFTDSYNQLYFLARFNTLTQIICQNLTLQ